MTPPLSSNVASVPSPSPAGPPGPGRCEGPALVRNLGALLLLLSFVVVAGKLHKLVVFAGGLGARNVAAVLGLDLALLVSLVLACRVALARARGGWRCLIGGALYLAMLVFLTMGLAEHGFFVIQGEFLPGEMLVYAVREFPMIRSVLASKLGLGVWLTLCACVLVLVLPAALARARRASPPADRSEPRRPEGRLRRGAVWAAALLGCLAASRLELPAGLLHLRRNAIVTLAGEALLSDPERSGARGEPRSASRLKLAATSATRRHNVVFVVLESTRARSVTPYAPELPTTPFLDRLAARGLRVERAYSVLPHTSKALVPIECGVHPKITTAIHEARPWAIPEACLAELLAAKGYATAFVQPAEEEFEARRGLVANFGFATFLGKESLPRAAFEESSYFGYEDDSMLEPVLQWVDARRGPFFLTVLTLTSHHDYRLPSRFATRSYALAKPLDRYLNALAYTDRFVERLFQGFEARGLARGTLFVIVGDHGEAFGEHGRFEHDNVLYEEGIRVPLLLVGAGLEEQQGKVVSGLRETSDIVPTVLELLGYASVGGRLHGLSLLSSPGHERLFFSCWYTKQCLALLEGSTKTIYHYGRLGPEQFDLAADPLERRNLAAGYAADALQVEIDRLRAWKQENNDRYRGNADATSAALQDVRE